MQITVDIPDALVADIFSTGQNPAQTILQDSLVEAFREERLTAQQLMLALDIPTRYALDGFLKLRKVWIESTPEQMADDQALENDFVANLMTARV